ncbi:hypothetical protein [Streptomyces winkii]|uniref:hypothetical protein n=1 Tax=Streptomyces winkii TaxID=3051178 RepID=UPI0028D490A4|nr:hypothetical protein [Streptomyces sp. DSM 40971]
MRAPVRELMPGPGPDPRGDLLSSGRESRGVADRWYGLPVRTRRTAAVAVCLAVLGAGGYAVASQPHGPWWQTQQQPGPEPDSALPSAAARRMPYPAQTARITFDRLAVADRARRTFTIELEARSTSPLSVLDVDQGYEAVDLRLVGRPPVPVEPGRTRTLTLTAKVTNCDRAPLRARSPFLNVTLRNDRARQELSVIPGKRYADALTLAFRTLCRPDAPAGPPEP